jgi:hypothetical protein
VCISLFCYTLGFDFWLRWQEVRLFINMSARDLIENVGWATRAPCFFFQSQMLIYYANRTKDNTCFVIYIESSQGAEHKFAFVERSVFFFVFCVSLLHPLTLAPRTLALQALSVPVDFKCAHNKYFCCRNIFPSLALKSIIAAPAAGRSAPRRRIF